MSLKESFRKMHRGRWRLRREHKKCSLVYHFTSNRLHVFSSYKSTFYVSCNADLRGRVEGRRYAGNFPPKW